MGVGPVVRGDAAVAGFATGVLGSPPPTVSVAAAPCAAASSLRLSS